MNKSVVVTARIGEQLSADLDRLAGLRERSRAWLVEKAIIAFVAEELAFHDAMTESEAEIERGEYRTHEAFMAELRAEHAPRQAA